MIRRYDMSCLEIEWHLSSEHTCKFRSNPAEQEPVVGANKFSSVRSMRSIGTVSIFYISSQAIPFQHLRSPFIEPSCCAPLLALSFEGTDCESSASTSGLSFGVLSSMASVSSPFSASTVLGVVLSDGMEDRPMRNTSRRGGSFRGRCSFRWRSL